MFIPFKVKESSPGKVAMGIAIVLFAQLFVSQQASAAKREINADPWQIQRLFSPSKSDLASELHGQIVIYSGLLDTEVERAMDLFFDRIGAMMFIQTISTDASGKPKIDPESGEVEAEDDGC